MPFGNLGGVKSAKSTPGCRTGAMGAVFDFSGEGEIKHTVVREDPDEDLCLPRDAE